MLSRAADDVCFPLSDETNIHGHIDFEELAEWSRSQIEEKEDTEGNGAEWRHRKLSEPMLVNGKYRNRGGWISHQRDDEDNRPFRFTFFSDELQSTVHSPTLYELPQEDQSFQDLFGTGKTWWLDVNSPTDSEMKVLSSAFGIHPLTAEDISMEEQREKVELFRNYYLDGVLSFHFNSTPHPANVRRRIRQLRDYITVSSDWISYALIDDIVDAFSPLIQRIEYEVDTIDENVLGIDIDTETSDSEQSNMLRRIGACRKKVMGLLRLLGSKADVVKGFAKRCNEQWDVAPRSEIGLYLGDIQDHIVTMVQNLNHYEKILSRSHSNYLAQISIEMTKVNNDTNDVPLAVDGLGYYVDPHELDHRSMGSQCESPWSRCRFPPMVLWDSRDFRTGASPQQPNTYANIDHRALANDMPYGNNAYAQNAAYAGNDVNPYAAQQNGAYEMQTMQPVETMSDFFTRIDEIRQAIRHFDDSIAHINELHARSLNEIGDEQSHFNHRELEKTSADTRQLQNNIRDTIKKLENQNAQMPGGADNKTRVEVEYKNKYRAQQRRQVEITNPGLSPEEIESVVNSDQGQQIFAEATLRSNRHGEAKSALRQVQERHQDIKKIEQTIAELAALFADMNVMMEEQAEATQRIEVTADNTKKDLEQGNVHVDKAIKSARSARAKKWICFWIVVVIIIAVGLGVGLGVAHSAGKI
ncbi:hypothetical protein MRB53_039207 [Persea americana]|nr:hypothetical protein MRB53_039207 [Persea americana]